MGKQTFWEWIFETIINPVEYWFAKRWLDRQFGDQKYWGDYLQTELNKKTICRGYCECPDCYVLADKSQTPTNS